MTNKRHPHYECIVAWAEGKEIEWRRINTSEPWKKIEHPSWTHGNEYRIKPEKKPDVVKYSVVHASFEVSLTTSLEEARGWSNLRMPIQKWDIVKYVFDGDTDKLKEVTAVE